VAVEFPTNLIRPDVDARCPHCGIDVNFKAARPADFFRILESKQQPPPQNSYFEYRLLTWARCPRKECHKISVTYAEAVGVPEQQSAGQIPQMTGWGRVWPAGGARTPVPSEVPSEIAKDYTEAAAVEPISRAAAAALARRCLDHVLLSFSFSSGNLDERIEKFAAAGMVSSTVQNRLHQVRVVGNYGAHPNKHGLEVEDGETEALLEVLADLFDEMYAKPARNKASLDVVNAKLKAAGKLTIGGKP
jgi:Domain of unknown function (DUF4145)